MSFTLQLKTQDEKCWRKWPVDETPGQTRLGEKSTCAAITSEGALPVARPECGAPQFTLCTEPRRELVYRAEAGTCSVTEQAASSFCNRSPNRFASLRSCRSSCVAAITPAQRCFDKPVFAGCSGHHYPAK
ncbi:hypothetical protein HPB49_026278 [Dermacentor silvarum]|nr:hypothetical protein HPB49_026278 [Dermacentor silvarum]